MATIIDSLAIELGMDATSFEKGMKDVLAGMKKTSDTADRTAKDLEASGKKAAQFFGEIKRQVVGLFAVFTAGKGLSSFVTDIVSSDAAVGRLAKNIGVSTETLSEWQGVAERAGGSAEGMSSTLRNITKQMQDIAITGTPGAQVLQSLAMAGINISKYFDKATSSSERLLMASDAFSHMDAARAQALGAGMGYDEGTVNVLMQGRQAVMALLAEQQKIGATNEADAKSAQALQAAWRALGQASTDLGRKILTSLSPYIQELSAALLRLAEWAATHRPMVEAMFIGLAAAVTAFAVVIAAPVAGMAALSAGIGVAIAAIAVLYDDWKAWISGGESAFGGFWQYFADKWSEVSGVVTPVFESLKALFIDWVNGLRDALDLVVQLFTGNGDDIRKAWGALTGDLGKYFTDFVGLIRNMGPAILAAFKTAWGAAFNWVRGRAKALWDAITGKGGSDSESTSTSGAVTPQSAPSGAPPGSSGPSALADLISRGEGDYNSVNLGAKGGYKASTADLAHMTVAEVMRAQQSGQFNAAGRYQVIGSTLADAVKSLGLSGNEMFDQGTQDRIFQQYLIGNKRKEIGDYINGKSNDIGAALAAASKEWASVADPATGQSHYAGVGNNKASISAAEMTQALQAARSQASGGSTSSKTDVQIGSVTVQTQATDAKGIAKDIGSSLKQYAFTANANMGLR
jgi:muramidase (phage lysozyme)